MWGCGREVVGVWVCMGCGCAHEVEGAVCMCMKVCRGTGAAGDVMMV